MELYEEREFGEKKKSKLPIIIGISIAILVIITIAIIAKTNIPIATINFFCQSSILELVKYST